MLEDRQETYRNFSGCGNTFKCNHPVVRRFIVDCLRYWVLVMHVDGFRFDLGSVLNRGQRGELLTPAALVEYIAEDPVLAKTKLMAEPWDAGGGYQVGNFHKRRWAEWNDRFRDEMRRFWHGEEGFNRLAATRFGGSEDLYALSGRKPYHSINYVSCHDGFTLNDVVSYNCKHNDMNGEGNRDGNDANYSYNYGFEGATTNHAIETLRVRQMKNLFLSLMLSQGTPLMLGGDEVRRTKHGNNNTYCQDNKLSWVDWTLREKNAEVLRFFRMAIHYRRVHPAFRRPDFFRGTDHSGDSRPDIQWCDQKGKPIDWAKTKGFLAFLIDGSMHEILHTGDDDDFYVACNPDQKDASVTLPPLKAKRWFRAVDTSVPTPADFLPAGSEEDLQGSHVYVLPARSMAVFIAK
jgi:glycogen operon protein